MSLFSLLYDKVLFVPGEISHQASATDHLVHMDLMQDWRDGKLGNAPQVVIVHPNGRIEEVTPSLEVSVLYDIMFGIYHLFSDSCCSR